MRFRLGTLLAVVALAVISPAALANHLVADCPVELVGSVAPVSSFIDSPHGVFQSGSVIYALRGRRLTTLNVAEQGDVQVVRDDALSALAAREATGGAAFRDGYLYLSGEGGLEVYDLRNTHGGTDGVAPVFVSRTANLHYRRLAVLGNLLAGLYPASDLPCFPTGRIGCSNSIDIYNVSNPAAPVLVSSISAANNLLIAFNDIAFTNGYLWATGFGGTFAFDLTNPAAPVMVRAIGVQGSFLATNGANLLAIGQPSLIGVFAVGPNSQISQFQTFTLPSIVDRSNELMFNRDAAVNDSRLIAMVDEKDPLTGLPARTIAFDIFDLSVPFYEGFDDRIYENVSYTYPDEVKHNPTPVGSFIYVVGEMSGTQVWGACGVASGRIEFDTLSDLTCGGAEIHGWVTGPQRITRVELFLDNSSLGIATLTNPRTDIQSATPVIGWRIPVNLDAIASGNRVLRAVASDILGNRTQIFSKTVYFNGPGQNCTARRRATKR